MATSTTTDSSSSSKETLYRTKTVHFLGRSTPIILQNDNGPCPLLAICNVLLLRNSLYLTGDPTEVPLQKLLSLVAEKLIDSNSNIQDKDEEYVINQQQNIADAIDLLPRLATGIDVNVQFRKINDFEFTRECAIFDLLDIGLYHGWIVDPQDNYTSAAIGSKSYNTLVGELVAFETRKSQAEDKSILEEDSVDFAAATTAALGVPSPCLSRGRSFDDCPVPVLAKREIGKGDEEEEDELMRALNLSKAEMSNSVGVSMSPDANPSHILEEENTHTESSGSAIYDDFLVAQTGVESLSSQQSDLFAGHDCSASSGYKDNTLYSNVSSSDNDALFSNTSSVVNMDKLVSEGSGEVVNSTDLMENVRNDMLMGNQAPAAADRADSNGCNGAELTVSSREDQLVTVTSGKDVSSQLLHNPADNLMDGDSTVFSSPLAECADYCSSSGGKELPNVVEVASPSLEGSEPIYEGEECMLDPGHTKYEDQEPVYEGEMVLAEQADKMEENNSCVNSEDKATKQQCQLIKNFLESSASQLTIYGLFCLQEGLKERELCVFFRNNHFNTMFKFNGELYLLATDQGYISQPDLVWEKLNEVNGDTVFMTGNFTEFKVENQVNDAWNEQNAVTSTADYLSTLEGSAPTSSSFNSDLQLAIALQQQEFEQQPQRPQQETSQQPQQSPVTGRSRLVTGPQVSRPPHTPQKSETKSKDKCTIM